MQKEKDETTDRLLQQIHWKLNKLRIIWIKSTLKQLTEKVNHELRRRDVKGMEILLAFQYNLWGV